MRRQPYLGVESTFQALNLTIPSEASMLSRAQTYILASVAVDRKIGQLADTPNVGVSTILPLDFFDATSWVV